MSRATARATTATAVLALTATFAVGCSATKESTKEAVSSATSAASSAAGAASSAATSAVAEATGTTTLYYPSQDTAMFSIDAPADWKVEKIAEVGDFGSLESANGSVLQFRAQTFATDDETSKEIDSIADSTFGFLKDNYTDVQLGDATKVDVNGHPGTEISGTGKDKDGNAVKFLSAMVVLGPKSIAEIWAAVFPEGNNDLAAAEAVLNSFKPAN